MADQPRRFVHDQQVGVLVDDVEKFFQAQGIVTTDGRRGTRILFFTEGNEGNKNENGFDANCANLRQFVKFVSTLSLSLFSSIRAAGLGPEPHQEELGHFHGLELFYNNWFI